MRIVQPYLRTKKKSRSDNSKGIPERTRENESKICMVNNCSEGRYQLSGFCSYHKKISDNWGHPKGKHIKRKEYQLEYEQVCEAIDRNCKTHKGILKAVSEIKSFLQLCSNNVKYPRELARLEASTITPIDILKESAALFLLRQGKPFHHPFVNDIHFTYCLGHNCIRLMPQEMAVSRNGRTYYKQTTGRARRVLGEFLLKRCTPLFMTISKHVLMESERERERIKVMSQPLT
jgi:hypothetical protein